MYTNRTWESKTFKKDPMCRITTPLLLALLLPAFALAEARIEKNVVYGMYSGVVLLMDVQYPAQPNGLGLVVVRGTRWNSPLSYNAPPIKNLDVALNYFVRNSRRGRR